MGLFRLVARVGCLSGGASRRLEEWSPIAARRGQNPAYRPSGVFFCGNRWRRGGAHPPLSLFRATLWPRQNDRMTGAFPAGAPMAPRGRPRPCASATGTETRLAMHATRTNQARAGARMAHSPLIANIVVYEPGRTRSVLPANSVSCDRQSRAREDRPRIRGDCRLRRPGKLSG